MRNDKNQNFLKKTNGKSTVVTLGTARLLLLFFSCANPVAPTGGPVDEDPPVLDTAASSPLLPVNFSKKNLEFVFDEFIELDNPATSVIISPPLQKRPDFRVRGRRLIMSFDEEEKLLPNTTYTINFGDAIRDITERNVLQNFLYVFSTGSFIDSLELRVIIKDAYTGLPAEGVLAMLHTWNAGDSALIKDKPVYFAMSDENGLAHLQYMRADSFRLFALKDQNRNYLLDVPAEYSGFYPHPIILPEDEGESFEIMIYQRMERLFPSSRRWQDGSRYSIKYNRPTPTMKFEFPKLDVPYVRTHHADTTVFHFGPTIIKDSILLVATEINGRSDTLKIAPPRSSDISPLRIATLQRNLIPGENALIRFNHIIDSFDRDSLIYVDTLPTEDNRMQEFLFQSDSLLLKIQLAEGEKGDWILLPGAVRDVFGQTNDSIRLSFTRQQASSMAQLMLEVTGLDSNYQYILQLEDQRETPVKTVTVRNNSFYEWDLKNLRPDRYTLRVIEDVNFNNMWDPGDPIRRRFPERVKVFPIIDLRANWEFEQQIESGFLEPEEN